MVCVTVPGEGEASDGGGVRVDDGGGVRVGDGGWVRV